MIHIAFKHSFERMQLSVERCPLPALVCCKIQKAVHAAIYNVSSSSDEDLSLL